MKYPDDFDDRTSAFCTIEDDVNGVPNRCFTTVIAAVADVIAAQAGKQITAIDA